MRTSMQRTAPATAPATGAVCGAADRLRGCDRLRHERAVGMPRTHSAKEARSTQLSCNVRGVTSAHYAACAVPRPPRVQSSGGVRKSARSDDMLARRQVMLARWSVTARRVQCDGGDGRPALRGPCVSSHAPQPQPQAVTRQALRGHDLCMGLAPHTHTAWGATGRVAV